MCALGNFGARFARAGVPDASLRWLERLDLGNALFAPKVRKVRYKRLSLWSRFLDFGQQLRALKMCAVKKKKKTKKSVPKSVPKCPPQCA